ncbi:C4-dicarboxylate ABC transporter permease [Vibrio natriegens]|jgi:C4-dicarboxylate transporter DctM subunit|uniref:TRAP transporter large permease n=1 Tax=Vibrio natriegens TaxID=691 RepID=UPI0008041222|nr:TRAP transporter large permease [Vibrio natriegens]ANQ23804.1 C4-dicarboxylate ABC transporter permease [Vibrio natriegens]
MVTVTLFGVFLLLVLLGAPVAICLGVSSLVVLEYLPNTPNITLLAKSAVMGGNSFPLVAIPLFVLAGEIMQRGGLSSRIVGAAYNLVGHFKAGLAYVNVLASMFFAAISGSSPATVAAIGSNMIPEMERVGYKRPFSAAITAAAGITGVMIPPSIPLIIYGVTANQSIGKLFLAGVIPGIVFGLGFMLVAKLTVNKNLFPASRATKRMEDLISSLDSNKPKGWRQHSIWALIVPVIILGGIYGGIFTPTEAAGVAVVYALIISLYVYRDLKISELSGVFLKSGLTSATVLVMVVMAASFGRLLTLERVPVEVANLITSVSENPLIVLILINIMLLVVGMFMETIASIIILTPILLPIVQAMGVDPVHFGIIMTVNLAIGFCTPPLGANLFVATGVANVSLEALVKSITPFLFAMLVMLMLVTFIPQLSLLLPSIIM